MQANGETGSAIDHAARRLEHALAILEQRLARRIAETAGAGAFEQDRANLAAELDAARARERQLQEAGAEASQVLGQAIAEIRAALAAAEPPASESSVADEAPERQQARGAA